MLIGRRLVRSTFIRHHQAAVRSGVRHVLDNGDFAKQARSIAAGLGRAEGVDGALRILIEASQHSK